MRNDRLREEGCKNRREVSTAGLASDYSLMPADEHPIQDQGRQKKDLKWEGKETRRQQICGPSENVDVSTAMCCTLVNL